MARIKVAVSPFYGGESWVDELTNISFEKNPRGLNVYSIPSDLDLTNIRKAVRLNSLILVEGNIGDLNEVNEVIVEAPVKEEVKEEPKEEVEAPVADVEVSITQEAPKKKATKKKTK